MLGLFLLVRKKSNLLNQTIVNLRFEYYCANYYIFTRCHVNFNFFRIALKIEHAVTREVNNQLDSKPETKKLTRQEKDERLAECFFFFMMLY